jgi:hypothetical protein
MLVIVLLAAKMTRTLSDVSYSEGNIASGKCSGSDYGWYYLARPSVPQECSGTIALRLISAENGPLSFIACVDTLKRLRALELRLAKSLSILRTEPIAQRVERLCVQFDVSALFTYAH